MKLVRVDGIRGHRYKRAIQMSAAGIKTKEHVLKRLG